MIRIPMTGLTVTRYLHRERFNNCSLVFIFVVDKPFHNLFIFKWNFLILKNIFACICIKINDLTIFLFNKNSWTHTINTRLPIVGLPVYEYSYLSNPALILNNGNQRNLNSDKLCYTYWIRAFTSLIRRGYLKDPIMMRTHAKTVGFQSSTEVLPCVCH